MRIPTVRVQTFPNNEVRAVFFYASPRQETDTPVLLSGSESPLDITSKLKTAQDDEHLYSEQDSPKDSPKAGYGAPGEGNGFSTNGRRRLLRAGAVLDEQADYPQQILFATGTLPGSTYESKLAIAAWSGWAVNAMKAWFAKRVPGKLDMYVWEFQKRGALHIHYAILVKNDATRAQLLKEWRPQWQRIVDGIGIKAGVDMWRKNANYTHADNKEVLQADIQECEKSIARYLSKYVSKSQQQYLDNHWKKCKPSRFWGVSRPLCALLTARTEIYETTLPNRMRLEAAYEDYLSVLQSSCLVEHHYEVAKAQAKVIVGYCNQGERSWLLRKLITTQLSRGNMSEVCRSERETLCLRISRCLQTSEQLRNFVATCSGSGSVLKDISTGLSVCEYTAVQDSMILSYRYYIGQIVQRQPYVPESLRLLHKEIVTYCRENLASICHPIAPPPEPEKITPGCTNPGHVQLTFLP